MAHGFEDFGLPAQLHTTDRVPLRFFHARSNRRIFFEWLAHYHGIPLPLVDPQPWYALTYQDIVRPIEGARPFGKNLMNWDRINGGLVFSYILVLIDAFPEVNWNLFQFEGNLVAAKDYNIFTDGYCLPNPNVDVLTSDQLLVHVSGQSICRPYFEELARRLSIPDDGWARGWNNVTHNQIEALQPPMLKWESVKKAFSKSLFEALNTNFPELDFEPWLVGGNAPVGFGNRAIVGDEQARLDVRRFLRFYVNEAFALELTDQTMELLYDVGQRGLEQWTSVCVNHFAGSPQQMVEFAFPDYDWDPTQFGLNKERQRRVYHLSRSWMTNEERIAMDAQPNRGWERNLTNQLGENYPSTSLPNGHSFGGNESYITADILVMPRSVMLDVLGEDHTDPTLRRSNDRSMVDVHNRFHQRWIQDRQRWNLCWANNISTIAIGPEFQFTEDEVEQLRAVFDNLDAQQPSFHHLGFPENYEIPELGPNGIDVDQPPPVHYNLGTQATSTAPGEAEVA